MHRLWIVGPLFLLLFTVACGHTHAHARVADGRRAEFRHHHRLDCGHLVACQVRGGRHHHVGHRSHRRYVHLHTVRAGHRVSCTVTDGRHRH